MNILHAELPDNATLKRRRQGVDLTLQDEDFQDNWHPDNAQPQRTHDLFQMVKARQEQVIRSHASFWRTGIRA